MIQRSEERSIVRNETVGGVDGHVENVELERSASDGEMFSQSRVQCDEIQQLERRLDAVEEEFNESKKR